MRTSYSLLLLILAATAQSTARAAAMYPAFKAVESFSAVKVSLEGSAKNIGLNSDELNAFALTLFKGGLPKVEYKALEGVNLIKATMDPQVAPRLGIVQFRVWTVGDVSPVAFYISIRAGSLEKMAHFEADYLGCGSKGEITGAVHKYLGELTAKFAAAYLEATVLDY